MPINRNTTNTKVVKQVNETKTTESKQEKPICDPKSSKKNDFGVTYYQINDKDDKLYGEDNTKGCGLTNYQIDANFNYLHGDDIKEGKFDDKKQALVLDRWFKDNDELRKVAKDHEKTIGPIKIPTDKLLDGTSFDGENGNLTINFNGKQTIVPGFNDYSDKLSKEISEIREILVKNSLRANISVSPTIGERGKEKEVVIIANLESVQKDQTLSKVCKTIIIKYENGEIIDEAHDVESLKKTILLNSKTDFETKITYAIDDENNIVFSSNVSYLTYYCIEVGYYNITSGKYVQNEKLNPKSSAKKSFYDIELPEEPGNYKLCIYIPYDVYINDNNGAYTFRYNGYGIDFTEDMNTIEIDNIVYHVFSSDAVYNNGEYSIEIL